MVVPQFKEIRQAYGFEEVAIVPGDVTINPDQTDMEMEIGHLRLSIPVLASAMDAVVDPSFAVRMSEAGGVGVMNLEGVYTRYEDAAAIISEISEAPAEFTTGLLQKLYTAPIREDLIGKRIQEIKGAGATCAVSVTPQNTKQY